MWCQSQSAVTKEASSPSEEEVGDKNEKLQGGGTGKMALLPQKTEQPTHITQHC